MFFQRITLILLLYTIATISSEAANYTDYLPKNNHYDSSIPTPESILGFGVGERHIRHDQLLAYLQILANDSKRVKLTEIGRTVQLRKQVLLTISSPENLRNLDEILAKHQTPLTKDNDDPLVIWLGYSVHGDEISGSNAALLVAYHFAASQHKDVNELLSNTIIVIEPSINPDGMDRFVNWVTTHRGTEPNADSNHIEHHQGWPDGRTNHFWFDLNRDWLLLSQKESKNRLAYFHQYQPHVVGDFHEMNTGSYFFQPGIPSRTHPITPLATTELTELLGGYHAKALDKDNRLYYSKESFDDFYYGKGSTYPDINGSVGVLFEQATSRGMLKEGTNRLLTFEFGIKNHLTTSLSTVKGAWENREKFKKYKRQFYIQAEEEANNEDFKGYLIHEADDEYRLTTFLQKLALHQIKVYPLTKNFEHKNKDYAKGTSYFIPLAQRQYRVIKALFNQQTNFRDNTFYDVSGWTLPLAMNIEFHQIDSTRRLELSSTPWKAAAIKSLAEFDDNAYAYAFDWHHFLAPKLLNQILTKGIKVRVAPKSFVSHIDGQPRKFKAGTIIILAGIQTQNNWRDILMTASRESQIELSSMTTGYTPKGIDLGSDSMKRIKPVKVLLLGGEGISDHEAGEIRFYLDDTLNIPVSVIEKDRIGNVDLSFYTHIILVDGNYSSISASTTQKFENWIKQGGVVFAQKRAAKWLSEKEILKTNFISREKLEKIFESDNLVYKDREKLRGQKLIRGSIFESTLDLSHPLAYGYNREDLPVFRNSTLMMETPSFPFSSVSKYTDSPLLSGYADKRLIHEFAGNSAIVAHNFNKGRVIATTDVMAFRGYWYGSAKILANSLFFAKAFDVPPPN